MYVIVILLKELRNLFFFHSLCDYRTPVDWFHSEALEDATRLYRQVRSGYERLVGVLNDKLMRLSYRLRMEELRESTAQVGCMTYVDIQYFRSISVRAWPSVQYCVLPVL
jgi:hypothetical protein